MEEDVVLENDTAEDHTTDDPVCSSKHNLEDEDEEESGKAGWHRPFQYPVMSWNLDNWP
jgi:hypothetical protein